MIRHDRTNRIVLVATILGAAGAAFADLAPGRLGLLAAGALVCLVAFVFWPWAVLPVGLVGATAIIPALGDGHVTFIVEVHAGVLATGAVALVTRRMLSLPGDEPVRTIVDLPMLVLAGIVLVAAGYGLTLGNARHDIFIAAYELAVAPAYFFLATHTLTSEYRLRAAGILYVVLAGGLAVSQFTQPGRHGGLLSVLVLPSLLVTASRLRGVRRAGIVLLIAGFAADITLAAYRAMWLATGLALLVLFVRAKGPIRRAVSVAALTGVLLTANAVLLSAGAHARAVLVGQELHQSAGYRASEAAVGLNVFDHRPLLGGGLGQSVPDIYLPDFAVTNVGPTYHVFYVMILANMGLMGLVAMLWPLLRALRAGLAHADGHSLAFACLTCGFLASAAFAGPTDGHWELGLLPALTLLTARLENKAPSSYALEGAR
ncbi:O-antigen ligase family protein [Actinocrinis puniceicyclus]|uniref:O-antigen ligase family protein n=1 Tax=Actinocrinis puniceicyclus TaxID=977794 RepID=A0A8J8BCR0_9ACTN|nr:O-antigen ligase family protein [Actinocrinis puniceicyclus]MBS2962034.1 O-antigen ligase family protein [Actinocrinis puniceicyclus]